MIKITRILELPPVYRAWQLSFARKKMAPIVRHNDLRNPGRVLDIGCGPGTNASYFQGSLYLGLDFNPEYIRSARARYPGMRFITADATKFKPEQRYDFVLLNSLLHHLNDDQANAVLTTARESLVPEGQVHIIELLTSQKRIPRALTSMDRGEFPRPLKRWRELFLAHFCESFSEPFVIRKVGVDLWDLFYFRGQPK